MPVEGLTVEGLVFGPEHEILNFQDKESLEDQTDVYNIFQRYGPPAMNFYSPLTKTSEERYIVTDQYFEIIGDLQRRARALGMSLTSWALIRSDLPLQLSESSRSSLARPSTLDSQEVENQLLSNGVGPFAKEILVRDIMNLVVRHDGISNLHRPRSASADLAQVSFCLCHLSEISAPYRFVGNTLVLERFCNFSDNGGLLVGRPLWLELEGGPIGLYTGYTSRFSLSVIKLPMTDSVVSERLISRLLTYRANTQR